MFVYSEITDDIKVEVEPVFLPEQSSPDEDHFFFAYKVHIRNQGEKQVQLIGRKWVITDGHGVTEEVRGLGVVGEQPWLEPNQSYSYTSCCPLTTPTGNMRGAYDMQDEFGNKFRINIPLFFLRDTSGIKMPSMNI